MKSTVIADYDILTPYGMGVGALWDGLMSGKTAIRPYKDIDAPGLTGIRAAAVCLDDGRDNASRFMRMVRTVLAERPPATPRDAALLVATTTGECDLLERAILGSEDEEIPALTSVLPKLQRATGTAGPCAIVSSACASSTVAMIQADTMLRHGKAEAVMVVGADCLSEFVLSGFSSLMALDEDVARPFDRDRAGLSVGEAAGYVLMMSAERAAREGVAAKGFLRGGGMTNDANHMTGPSRDGAGLAGAVRRALKQGGCRGTEIACVAAHGTGTVYNDAMEMKALRLVFSEPVPIFSIKGGIGHTMGNAGLAQAIVALESLRRGAIPPTVGVSRVDDDAAGWVSSGRRDTMGHLAIAANAGFGGVNAAVLVESVGEGEMGRC